MQVFLVILFSLIGVALGAVALGALIAGVWFVPTIATAAAGMMFWAATVVLE